MDKLSQISFGKGDLLLKFGTIIILVSILIISYCGIYLIKIPQYNEVNIVYEEPSIYVISKTPLKNEEKITFENGEILKIKLENQDSIKYKLSLSNLNQETILFLQEKYLSKGKILVKEENLFESILP